MEEIQTRVVENHVPHAPGVYLFQDNQGNVLYVGKARDLHTRVRQYFSGRLGDEKTRRLVGQIGGIETIRTANEFDALLLEARLIHDRKPRYNVIAKDDRSPIYLVLTLGEELPHVLLIRRSNLPKYAGTRDAVFGPFQSGTVARWMLKTLRHIIPFCTQKERNGKACFYTHLGLCHPCPSVIAAIPRGASRRGLVRLYRRHIQRLTTLLSGKSKSVLREIEAEMQRLAKHNQFEEANVLKRQIRSLMVLTNIHFDPSLYLSRNTLFAQVNVQELSALREILLSYYPALPALRRIECIDISNIMGKEATGSLVIFTDGMADKRWYRRFRIRGRSTPSDTAMIAQVLARRLKHTEWPLPDLLLIDGGKGQVRSAVESVRLAQVDIPIIGLAKHFEEIVVPRNGSYATIRLELANPAIQLLQRIRDEAHRFAKFYHVKLRAKTFFGPSPFDRNNGI